MSFQRDSIPPRFIIALITHEGPSCEQLVTSRGDRLLKRRSTPLGRADFHDGVCAPLISMNEVSDIDFEVRFLEPFPNNGVVVQTDGSTVNQKEVDVVR